MELIDWMFWKWLIRDVLKFEQTEKIWRVTEIEMSVSFCENFCSQCDQQKIHFSFYFRSLALLVNFRRSSDFKTDIVGVVL
jgi:hypothetical protein